jgi:hypothetical protein
MEKRKIKRIVKISKKILLVLLIITTIFFIYLFSNPKQRIVNTDFETGSFYLKVFDKIMSDSNKEDLFKSIIFDNNDVSSLNLISYYALVNNKCELIVMLDQKCNDLKSLKRDRTWTVKLSSNHYKESSTQMVYMNNGICEHTEKLKAECFYPNSYSFVPAL